MSVLICAGPAVSPSVNDPFTDFAVAIIAEGDSRVVHVSGELDLATRDQLYVACTSGNHPNMVVDLTRVTFMDCSGYESLVASRLVVESVDRRFAVRGVTGQPAHLLALIETLESAQAAR